MTQATYKKKAFNWAVVSEGENPCWQSEGMVTGKAGAAAERSHDP